MNVVAKVEPHVPAALTPMDMLNQAVERGASIDILEKLMALQERWEGNQARKAFDAAIAGAKAELPVIMKNREVNYGNGKASYRFEDFAQIARTIDPILGKHGLTYRFRTKSENGLITVTCVISHKDGHSEENSLSGAPDNSGSKNNIQAIGSAQTYLQRYTLKSALGLAASADDDARSVSQSDTISEEQASELIDLCEAVGADRAKFCKYMRVEKIADLPASQFAAAKQALEAKRSKQ